MVIRPTVYETPGGDTVQMQETARALRDLGVEVREAPGPQAVETYAAFDVAHLFNLQTTDFTLGEARKARAAGRPVALSTIYWDFALELAYLNSPRWRLLARVTGRSLASALLGKKLARLHREYRAAQAEIVENADLVLPNSEGEIRELLKIRPDVPPARVVPNAIDPDRFDPSRELSLPDWAQAAGLESGSYLLVVGRIDATKNQLGLLRALRGAGIPIALVGQGEGEYVEACREMGALLPGPQDGDELLKAYRHARVHALPSIRETPGLASLEAAAMGCRIVSTRVGSAREYFGPAAQYCDPLSTGSIRKAVLAAWSQEPDSGLSQLVRSRYTWAAAAKATLDGYHALRRRER